MTHLLKLTLLVWALGFTAQAVAADAPAPAAAPAAATAPVKKKNVQYRKTQEVSFDGSDVDGQVRSPDGAYLLQKRGVPFMPLYKVNNQFEKNILESVEYLR
jgi:hypothetical protein